MYNRTCFLPPLRKTGSLFFAQGQYRGISITRKALPLGQYSSLVVEARLAISIHVLLIVKRVYNILVFRWRYLRASGKQHFPDTRSLATPMALATRLRKFSL
jgi:hypothetical protein